MAGKSILDEKNLRMFGQDYVKILVAFLKKEGKKASGALINSIDSRVKMQGDIALIEILSNDYLKYVDEGRKKGKYPPIQAISRWCDLKGIPTSAAFPIARSIFKFGIEPTNVIQKTKREIETSPTLNKKYNDLFTKHVEELIYQQMYLATKEIR